MGTAMEIMMAKVPQDVPVEKAIKEERMKMMAGSSAGESQPSVMPATYVTCSQAVAYMADGKGQHHQKGQWH